MLSYTELLVACATIPEAIKLNIQMEAGNETLRIELSSILNGFICFFNNKVLPDMVDEQKVGSTGWKAHVSIDPEDLARGWDLIYPLLKEHAVMFKVTNVNKRKNEKEGDRLHDGMQVTLYMLPGSEKTVQILLNNIEHCLRANGIKPGKIHQSDKSLGDFVSVRHAGSKEYVSAARAESYNPENVPDPFVRCDLVMPQPISRPSLFSRFKQIVGHIREFNSQPKTFSEIKKNQRLRREAMQAYQSAQDPLSGKNLGAVKRFWSTQTYFCVDLFQRNHNFLRSIFPDIFAKEKALSKDGLLRMLDKLIICLQAKDERCANFIDLICEDNSPMPMISKEVSLDSDGCALHIVQGDAYQFARDQTAEGMIVLIMDAANRQRLGDSACKKGTFQEAGTRELDSYLKNIALFRNVLADLSVQQQLAVDVTKEKIDSVQVSDYQMDFLQLILTFVRQAVRDEEYFALPHYKSDFLAAANNIYGRIQNSVFEVPFFEGIPTQQADPDLEESKSSSPVAAASTDPRAGFLKNLRFVPPNINSPADLFEADKLKEALFEGEAQRLLMMETVAPDRRRLNRIDRACTFHRELQRDGIDEQLAQRSVRASMTCVLDAAITNGADIILINAFGCKAFENSPETIANDMAAVLRKYAPLLKNKQIYFMDLDPKMCEKFGKHFSELKDVYQFKPMALPAGSRDASKNLSTKSYKNFAIGSAVVLGGAGIGALLGTFVIPGLGSLIGAAIGAGISTLITGLIGLVTHLKRVTTPEKVIMNKPLKRLGKPEGHSSMGKEVVLNNLTQSQGRGTLFPQDKPNASVINSSAIAAESTPTASSIF